MTLRSALKEESLQRILKAGSVRLREEGLSGAVIASVMKDAGLTHGAFYSHFKNKDDLLVAALEHALKENRPRWIDREKNESWQKRLIRLARRYLTTAHRDNLADSCALAALASDTARAGTVFRRAYETELNKSLEAVCNTVQGRDNLDPDRFDEAVMFMALCVGGISLSRAVKGTALSDRILAECRKAAARIGVRDNQPTVPSDHRSGMPENHEDNMAPLPELDHFPVRTYEKLRYADTDRQGHVNNAVFSTMLETGRVEILYNPGRPLAGSHCAFVIASQTIDFSGELSWPGRVEIGTRVCAVGRSSVTFEQALFQHGGLSATARTVIVQMNETTRRSEPLNDATVAHLTRLMSPVSADRTD